jgi:hypothetical protein
LTKIETGTLESVTVSLLYFNIRLSNDKKWSERLVLDSMQGGTEEQILHLHHLGLTRDEITRQLHVGSHRICRVLSTWMSDGTLASAKKRGRPL